ncbi:sugar ABC transporter substrate-binding protein [Georgenia sp. SYP-B2076]|uniref:sugar ABC transporter substrate-binding protein n=1 Tax=Georgenia sp. SYP-B2076 TaxID=2495881 RepID=UPI000F8C6368|nr:sugar ABC transporter substrate-binding protein [Georgenia sp. SYP-B2076]
MTVPSIARHLPARPATVAALLAVGALVLSACSDSSSTADAATTAAAGDGGAASCEGADRQLELAFVYATTGLSAFQEMAMGAQAAADDDGNVKLTLSAPTAVDGPEQVSLFQSAVRVAGDGVAYQSLFPDLMVRPLNDAVSQDIPVVAVDAAPPAGTEVTTFVGNSNFDLGVALGEAFVAQDPAEGGTVVLGNAIPSLPLLGQRLDGLQSVIAEQRSDLTVVGPLDSKSEPTENLNTWRNIIQSNPDAVAYLGVGDQDGVSLPLLKQQLGKDYLAGSADISPDALAAVEDGRLFALSSPEHWLKGYIAIQLLIDAQRACEPLVEGWWNSGSLLIDSSNVGDVIERQADEETRKEWFAPVIAEQLATPPLSSMDKAE